MARYAHRGNIEVYFIPDSHTMSDAGVYDEVSIATDLAAGTNVRGSSGGECIVSGGMTGWETQSSTIDVPDLCSLTTGNIPGEITAGEATIRYYHSDDSSTIYDVLVPGATGWIVIGPYGATATDMAITWPVEVFGRNLDLATGNEAATYTVTFSRGVPNQDGAFVA